MNNVRDICRVCGSATNYLWNGVLLDLHSVRYFECPSCGYMQTESPYWLDEAYSNAINNSDTGIMNRNLYNVKYVLATLVTLGHIDGLVVDCAGGYGIMVRLLRDLGVDALWSDRYCQNMVARGFEYSTGAAILVTAFEAFEHFVNPAEELEKLFAIAPHVLFSTELIMGSTHVQDDWCYYGKEHGQHIGFFRLKTLEYLAHRYGKYLISNGHSYHLFSDVPVNKFVWRGILKTKLYVLPSWKLKSKTLTDHLTILKRAAQQRV